MTLLTLSFIVKLFCVMLLSLVLNFLLVRYQRRIPLLDVPNERSSHTKIMPRSGGIAMFIAFTYGVVWIDIEYSLLFFFPLSFVFLIGLWDDISSLSSKTKLLLTALAAIVLFNLGFDVYHFGTFFGHEVVFGYVAALLFFAFAVSGFVSAVNLIDGLDGLASVISLAILFPFFYMGYKYDDTFLCYTTLILMSSISGFLAFNWHPAKIFMGDSGSMFIGFAIAILVVYAIKMDYITAISTLLLAGLPIMDTLVVMLRRLLHRHNPFKADKTHIHHILLRYQQNNVRKTVVLLGLMQILFSYLGLGFKVRDDIFIFILYGLCFIVTYLLLTINSDTSGNKKDFTQP